MPMGASATPTPPPSAWSGRRPSWLRGRAVDEVLALQPGHTAPLADRAGRGQALAVRLPDGHQALDLFTAPLHAGAGVQTGEVLALRDVTTEQRNRQELERLSLAVQHSASAILITDPTGRIEYVNPKFTKMTGFTRDEIGGQTPRFLKSGQATPEVYDTMWAAARAPGPALARRTAEPAQGRLDLLVLHPP